MVAAIAADQRPRQVQRSEFDCRQSRALPYSECVYGDDDDYEHADGFGGYRRQRGEYIRPVLDWRLPEGRILHDVAATNTYGQFLVQYSVGDIVDAELVPEPHKVFDDHALCVDICGLKIGYVGSVFAEFWHPFVAAMNRRGYSVVATAEIAEGYSDNDRSVDIRFPEWHQWTEIYSESRIDHGFDTLWSALSPEVQTTLMDGFGESEWATTKNVIAHAHLMPTIDWKRENTSSSRGPSKYSSATRHAIEINRNETHATPPTKPERNSDRVNAQNAPDVSPTSAHTGRPSRRSAPN